ncbi:hypothetical protein Mal15_34670 [Stieleria maiorica]|uniref:Uncharacterized protein n=1 Tax=Stieleria maiorica TaxID=2795974 RepID=A0A5B9MF03_9BACT|nr:hypothetical protein [Stieleria maiorica]QEF99403.1 hypothetical protein Mal15_34670 [Stieleria maiorica]
MMNKLLLAAVVSVGGMAVSESTTQAGDCYYRRPAVRSGYAYRAPVAVPRVYTGSYRAPVYPYVSRGYRPYSSYRPGFGYPPGYRGYIGPGVRFGGYPGYGYGRSGISIGFGF